MAAELNTVGSGRLHSRHCVVQTGKINISILTVSCSFSKYSKVKQKMLCWAWKTEGFADAVKLGSFQIYILPYTSKLFPFFAQWCFHKASKGQLQCKTFRDNLGIQKTEMFKSSPEFPHLMTALPSPKYTTASPKEDATPLHSGTEWGWPGSPSGSLQRPTALSSEYTDN